jgi:hypothetical protein
MIPKRMIPKRMSQTAIRDGRRISDRIVRQRKPS